MSVLRNKHKIEKSLNILHCLKKEKEKLVRVEVFEQNFKSEIKIKLNGSSNNIIISQINSTDFFHSALNSSVERIF